MFEPLQADFKKGLIGLCPHASNFDHFKIVLSVYVPMLL